MIGSDNSIQTNIKFTLTMHEYIIVYEHIGTYSIIYILYIYYILYMHYIYYIYIYIHMNFVFFVYCNIVATHTYNGHTGFSFVWSFPACFACRNGLHNCEHDPSY